ncbi:ABC transporter ATP-binding protein [Pseudonocardia sp. GCM10023141]|uniref:ABC transporter ATP-binding protein n=1 Tax=Pseudonocardia sp. GCM10023141 TaxID=3252653 RepID=UPI003609602F
MIRLEGVRKSYRGPGEVLAGIDLELAPGRPVAVVGTNGSGKSTLLRIVAGCSAPSAGAVTGRPPVVGFLPGQFPASTRMPAGAYLRRMAAVHGVPDADTTSLLEELGFTGVLGAPVSQLSTGNAQKVGLTQALSCRPALLVLDEPWTALDVRAAAALDHRLAAEAARGAMIIVTDHGGRADGLPGALVMRMAAGVLTADVMAGRRDPGHSVIELRCPGAPADALRGLPPVGESWFGPGRLTVRVPADRGDALLAAALAGGCSVLGVWRESAS